jgi:hypothetical protein
MIIGDRTKKVFETPQRVVLIKSQALNVMGAGGTAPVVPLLENVVSDFQSPVLITWFLKNDIGRKGMALRE